LAAVAVAATAEYCLGHGFSAVGWHCNAQNTGSWKTAEKVGFERGREYAYYYYMYDPVDHLAELGWYHYRRGEYAKTVQYYEQAFARRTKYTFQ
jgi:RimJ/RimL family protein N-acetyltransferase